MKRLFAVLMALSLVLVLLPVGAVAHTEEAPYTTPLLAGQNIDVGDVQVWNDGTQLCVKYQLSDEALAEGWLIYETHLAVATSPDDIPTNKPGNPAPGQFPYGDDDLGGVPYYQECISLADLDVECEADLNIAAHAVVEKGCNPIGDVYGIERNSGKVWGVDTTGATAEIFTTVAPPKTNVGPNGLGYDGENDRFYYCDYSGTTTLYYWDGAEHEAGGLPGDIAAADFDNGKYYFVTGPPASDDLYEVTFNTDGTIAGGNTAPIADIANNEHGWTFNGDIAVKDGVVYGWGLCGVSGHGYEYFTYDLTSEDFTFIKTTYQASLQLAFGLDGQLYGHRSGGDGDFYVIDTETGEVTLAFNTGGILFTDCASGAVCEPTSETAWGDGMTLVERGSWATYFTYTVQCPCVEQLWQIGTPNGAVNPIEGSAEYPADGEWYNEFTYVVPQYDTPILAPTMPGYIGSVNVCAIDSDRPCTDTAQELNIEFVLNCDHEAGELELVYDRYGSETDKLYFDLDDSPFATVVATESGFEHFVIPLPAADAGTHTITIAYEGGGSANGHYIDYLELTIAD